MRLNIRFILPTTILFAACPDPDKRFEEFEQNVVDAAETVSIDAMPLSEIPDISGRWFIAYRPIVAQETAFVAIWDVTMTPLPDGTAEADVSMLWLDASTRKLIPDTPAATLTDVPISIAGEWAPTFTELPVPPAANPVTGSNIGLSLTSNAKIKSADLFCGIVKPGITLPSKIVLDGSTFAAQRVAPDIDGDALPPTLAECPPDLPDAGPVADAAEPDASAPDASTPDAGVPDAS